MVCCLTFAVVGCCWCKLSTFVPFVVYCLLYVVCRVLFVVGCALVVAWCALWCVMCSLFGCACYISFVVY